MTETQHTIINGDSRKMSELQDKSVHLIITSPPYWQLKDYGNDNQIGFNDSYEQSVHHPQHAPVVLQDAPPRPYLVHGEEPVGVDEHCATRRHEAPQRCQLREKLHCRKIWGGAV